MVVLNKRNNKWGMSANGAKETAEKQKKTHTKQQRQHQQQCFGHNCKMVLFCFSFTCCCSLGFFPFFFFLLCPQVCMCVPPIVVFVVAAYLHSWFFFCLYIFGAVLIFFLGGQNQSHGKSCEICDRHCLDSNSRRTPPPLSLSCTLFRR